MVVGCNVILVLQDVEIMPSIPFVLFVWFREHTGMFLFSHYYHNRPIISVQVRT